MQIIFNPNIKDIYDGYIESIEAISLEVTDRYFNIQQRLDEVHNISVVLMKTPEEEMVQFNYLYAEAQANYSRISSILIDFIGERAFWKKQLVLSSKIYNRAKNYLLTSDELKNLRNKVLQEARVENDLYLVVSLMSTIKGALEDIKDMVEIATVKKEELDNAIINMNRQQRIVESLIGLGYQVRARRN